MTGVKTHEKVDGQQRIIDVLRRIKRTGGGPVSVTQLAGFAKVSRPTATASIERLVELGKVLERSSPVEGVRSGWIWKEEAT